MSTPASGRVRSLAVTLLFAMIASLAVVVPGVAAPAAAATNQDIVVDSLSLSHIDAAENPQPGQLTTSSVALLQWRWDASKTAVKEGDSFTIELPEVFTYRRQATEPVYYDFGNGNEQIGECVMAERLMTCTFNATMAHKVEAGYGKIKGDGKVHLSIASATTAEEVPFVVNGSDKVLVDLPGQGGIRGSKPGTYSPQNLVKGSTGMSEDSPHANWLIRFGTTQLSRTTGVAYDGATVHTITLNDTLGAGMSCPDQTRIDDAGLIAERSAELPDRASLTLDKGAAGSTTTSEGEFSLTFECGAVNADGTTPITIRATGPFDPDANYSVTYSTPVTADGGKAVPGFTYENKVSIEGTNLSASNSRTFVRSFSITVRMEAGFGNFRIAKYMVGGGATQVAPGAEFPVTVSYELPGTATTDDYPSWTAPGTVNPDKRGGTATFNVAYGSLTPFHTPFPVGTRVTLSEDLSGTAVPAGYEWGAPHFSTTTVSIEDRVEKPVTLTNRLDMKANYFQVVKNADGAPGAENRDYTFQYTCSDGTQGVLTAKGDGTPVQSDRAFAVGTVCEVTEDEAAAAIDGYTLDASGAQAQSVTVGLISQDTVTATFTNAYTQDAGRFSVTKVVDGDTGYLSPEAYKFGYTCTAPGQPDITGRIAVAPGTTEQSDLIPVGYTCTVTEDDHQAPGFTLDVQTGAPVTITKDTVQDITVTNTYTRLTGTFTVSKTVVGDYTATGADTFQVTYTCDDPDATTGSLSLPATGTPVSGPTLPTGTKCTITEDAASAARTGYAVATTYSTGSVTVEEGSTPHVTVTNTYTALKGGFTISKTVDGDGADLAASTEFTFDYVCTPVSGGAEIRNSVTLKGGTSVAVEDVPVGSCTVTERDATVANTSVQTSLSVDGTAVPGDNATFQVTDGATVQVSATNTYTRDRATFSVVKTVVGGDGSFANETFIFDYTCTDGSRGSLAVPGDGTPRESDPIETGAECTVTEREGTADRDGYTVVSEIANGGKVTIVKGEEPQVAATNTYTVVPTPSPSPTPTATATTAPTVSPSATLADPPSGQPLARTGASNVLLLGVIGTVLLAGGALAFVVKRRRDEA